MKLSAQEMLNKFSKNLSHPENVKKYSLMIFDEVNEKIHEMPDKYRRFLEAASLLHDIGYYKDSKSHNKHSMNMIIQEGLDGFSPIEERIIGCICRYHRGSLPDKKEHDVYNTFEKKERKIVKRLAGILRIADGLDKGHIGQIEKIAISYDEDHDIAEILLTPKTPEFLPDISDAIKKRDLFEIAFKCQCVLKFV